MKSIPATCKNCVWFYFRKNYPVNPELGKKGRCRKHAPICHEATEEDVIKFGNFGEWPVVFEGMYCGDFKLRIDRLEIKMGLVNKIWNTLRGDNI